MRAMGNWTKPRARSLAEILDPDVIEQCERLVESLPEDRARSAIAHEIVAPRYKRLLQLIGADLPAPRIAFLIAHAIRNGGGFSIELPSERQKRRARAA
jgi:hypothetical protein